MEGGMDEGWTEGEKDGWMDGRRDTGSHVEASEFRRCFHSTSRTKRRGGGRDGWVDGRIDGGMDGRRHDGWREEEGGVCVVS